MAAKGKRNQAGRAPISSHPAFPAIVALWFAALFGIGSMVLPVVLLEKLVTATGIASIVPAAAPPLGVTARILIALVAAGLGVVLGVVLARRVAAAQVDQPTHRRAPRLRAVDAHPDAPVKRPISAREELGSETLDDPFEDHARQTDQHVAEPMPGRRRALSVTDESGRSEFLDSAPLPYGDAGFVPAADASEHDEDALELEHLELAEEAPTIPEVTMPARNIELPPRTEAADDAICEPETNMATEPRPFERQDFAAQEETEPHPFETPEAVADLAASESRTSAQQQHVSPAPIDGPLAEPSIAQLVERFALALQTKAAEKPARAEPVAQPEFAPPSESEAAFEPSPAPAFAPAAPFAEPDHAEREPLVAEAPAPSADALEDRALAVPEALRPLDLGEFADEEEESDEDLAGLSLQLGGSAKPFARPADQLAPFAQPAMQEGELDEFEDEAGNEGYSSLLDMKRPLPTGQEFIRVEDDDNDDDAGATGPEPVVVFPNQRDRRAAHPAAGAMPATPASQPRPFDAPSVSESGPDSGGFAPATPTNPPASRADPGETEKALREALEKLQRMSGAA